MTGGITLENKGDRNVRMTEEKARELIESWKPLLAGDGQQVHILDLPCRVYEVPAATIICDFLKDKVSHVRVAHLNDIIASLPTDEGLAVLNKFSTLLSKSPLQELNLDDNALGIRGVLECEAILSCPSLLKLSLQNDGLSAESMTHLKEALTKKDHAGACTADTLEELVLYNNMIGVEGAMETGMIVAQCRKLRVLHYIGCRPQPEGTLGLVEGILKMTKTGTNALETLILEGTLGSTEDDPVGVLCQAFRKLPKLKNIKLYDVSLESSGAKLVLKSLRHLKNSLMSVNLAQNEIAASAIKYLAPVLQKNLTTLKVLNFSSNELTSVGVERLMAVFQGSDDDAALEELDLSENMIGTRGAEALIAAKESLPNLKLLKLNENTFPPNILENLQETYQDILDSVEDNADDEDADDDIDGESEDESEEEEEEEDDNDATVDVLVGTMSKKLTMDDVSL